MADPRITQIMEAADKYWEASTAARYRVRSELEAVVSSLLQAATQAQQPAQQTDLHAERRHTTQCRHYDNNCGAVHPSNCPDCPFRAAPQQPAQQAVRLLTSDELYAALPTPRTPGEYIGTQNVAFTWDAWQAYVGAVERKFCEVNGISLPPAAKEGEKKQ
jgi:hypothetical protein